MTAMYACLAGQLDTDRSQLRPPKVSVVFIDPLSAQKAIFIGENMAMSIGGHAVNLSLRSEESAAKRRKRA